MEFKKMFLDFSLDFMGECEDIVMFEVDGFDRTDEISESDVDLFVQKLETIEGFKISEHRTEVRVFWENGKMDIEYRFFNQPDDGEFDDIELIGLDPIELELEEVDD